MTFLDMPYKDIPLLYIYTMAYIGIVVVCPWCSVKDVNPRRTTLPPKQSTTT